MPRRLIAISIALLVAGFLMLLVFAGSSRSLRPGVVVALSTAVAAGVTMLAARAAGNRSGPEIRGAAEAAQRLSLTRAEDADAVPGGLGGLREVPRKARIGPVFTGLLDGRELAVTQSSYMVHTGQSAVMVAHTIYAVQAPHWPKTHVVPRGYVARLLARLGRGSGLALENVEFNIRFKVRADDEDFAIALLSPQMQAFMLGKTSVRWKIDPGRLCLIYSGTLKPARMEASLDRLRRFWSLVPRELEGW